MEDSILVLDSLFDDLMSELDVQGTAEETSDMTHGTRSSHDAQTSTVSDADDVLSLYLHRIGRVPLLTPEEEVALGEAIQAGRQAQSELEARAGLSPDKIAELEVQVLEGEAARQHFIEANTRLVVSVAKGYRTPSMPFQDLIQAGNLGLIRAVDRFDPGLGNRFSTYAIWWIRHSIRRALSQQGHTIRLPHYLRSHLQKVYHTRNELEKQLSRTPTMEELASALGEENAGELTQLLQIARDTVSLNAPVGETGEGELLNLIADDEASTPAEMVHSRLMREDLEAVIDDALGEREIQVLCRRFGLRGYQRHTLQELADAMGVSRERVRQIERKALRKLRHPYHRRRLLEYLR